MITAYINEICRREDYHVHLELSLCENIYVVSNKIAVIQGNIN